MSGSNDGLIVRSIRQLGAVVVFLGRILMQVGPAITRRPLLVVDQIYNAGGRSLIIVMLSGLFVGMVLSLQGYSLLQRFGSEEALGVAAAVGLLKELGPVVAALLFAGRAGTALTSEIGLMRATDQLTAMQIMAVDPVRYVVAPRFLGGLLSVPLLVAIFDAVGIFGAWLVGVRMLGVNAGAFWSQMQAAVTSRTVTEGFVKSCVFGLACSLVAVHQGYHSEPTARGVGLATTRTVVASSVLVLLLDYIITAAFI